MSLGFFIVKGKARRKFLVLEQQRLFGKYFILPEGVPKPRPIRWDKDDQDRNGYLGGGFRGREEHGFETHHIKGMAGEFKNKPQQDNGLPHLRF